jgi:hypothetical protein
MQKSLDIEMGFIKPTYYNYVRFRNGTWEVEVRQ